MVVDALTEPIVAANVPGWPAGTPVCAECARRFVQARAYLRTHGGRGCRRSCRRRSGWARRFRGRGVTLAFLDAGFYAHPDLVTPRDRILAYVDVTNPPARRRDLLEPDEWSWHGLMTSVVACGNGALQGPLSRDGGLDWVIRNRGRYGIGIVNVSVGGDYERSYLIDPLWLAVERAARAGLLVCAAVGNLGHLEQHPVLPPASAPAALSVGGLDDKNRLAVAGYDVYHSSYGPTLDGPLEAIKTRAAERRKD